MVRNAPPALPRLRETARGSDDSTADTVMQEMGLTDAEIANRKALVGLGDEDVRRIVGIRRALQAHSARNARTFFEHLGRSQANQPLFLNPALLEKAQRMKHDHLAAMLEGNYERDYVRQRLALALVYSEGQIEHKALVAAFHELMAMLGEQAIEAHAGEPSVGFEAGAALRKIAFFDLSLITDVLIFQRESTIRRIGREASQYARSLIESSLDPLVTISADGKITDVNEATVKVTGIPREVLIGSDFSVYFTDPDKAREGYKQVFAKGFVSDYALTIRHKDGRVIDVLYNASLYRDARGNVLGVFAAARDVTAQKRAEAEVAEQRSKELVRLAELERFQKLTVGRELKMIELKKEIADLKKRAGVQE